MSRYESAQEQQAKADQAARDAEAAGWKLNMAWLPGPGQLVFVPTCPHDDGERFRWVVPLAALLRELKVRPEQLRALLAEAEKPAPSTLHTMEELCTLALPDDLAGKTVLDVGGYDGRFAKLAAQRGAAQAVCLDSGQWRRYGWQEPARYPEVLYVEDDFMEWHGPADIVLFYNVLYHCSDPRAALEHLRRITREQMLLCTLTVWDDRPVWVPYAPREVNPDDETVYWGPSEAGLRKLLDVTGWKQIEEVGKAHERIVLRCS